MSKGLGLQNFLHDKAHMTLGKGAMHFSTASYAEHLNPFAISGCPGTPPKDERLSFVWKVGVLFLAFPPIDVDLTKKGILDDEFPMYAFIAQQEDGSEEFNYLGCIQWDSGGGLDPFFTFSRAQTALEKCLMVFPALKPIVTNTPD